MASTSRKMLGVRDAKTRRQLQRAQSAAAAAVEARGRARHELMVKASKILVALQVAREDRYWSRRTERLVEGTISKLGGCVGCLGTRTSTADAQIVTGVKQIVDAADPIGLLKSGAPDDEYEGEIDEIARSLVGSQTIDQTHTIVHDVFVKWLSPAIAGPRRTYMKLTRAIHALPRPATTEGNSWGRQDGRHRHPRRRPYTSSPYEELDAPRPKLTKEQCRAIAAIKRKIARAKPEKPPGKRSWRGSGQSEDPRIQGILQSICTRLPELEKLLHQYSSHWGYEDPIYRFYRGSFKIYDVQDSTLKIVDALRALAPERGLNKMFTRIVKRGTAQATFEMEHNNRWFQITSPMVEAFFHARFFLEMAVRYGQELHRAPTTMPSGWAALLTLYDL